MQKVIKSWLAFCLSLGVFGSCSEDRGEPSSATEGGERVSLGLYAEVSVDDSEARALNYKLGKNANGKIVPMPQFEDKQEVRIHTIIKSNKGAYAAKTLKWLYDAEKKKLVLAPTDREDSRKDENNISIINFNNDDDTKWYISALIGGTRSGTRVDFEGIRIPNGVDGNEGDIVGGLNVPYAFGWTELTIEKPSNTKVRGSYKYAEVPLSAAVKFTPLGSLIAVQLGNKQTAGTYTFTPTGFTIRSNAFGDLGSFELNTAVPTTSAPAVALPTWTEDTDWIKNGEMEYTLGAQEERYTIAHGTTAARTYYIWVMPHQTQPEVVRTGVSLEGNSNRPGAEEFHVRGWFTDYTMKSTQLRSGRVHKLAANVTHQLILPIEYVTDYNLAGGEGLTHQPTDQNPQPIGVTGALRFADSHSNDAGGYYNWYKLVGRKDNTYNPQGRNLQTEVDKVFGADKYYVPTLEHWWGIFPSNEQFFDKNGSEELDEDECIAVGFGDELIRRSYRSDWSAGTYTIREDFAMERVLPCIYAIRFKARPVTEPITKSWYEDAATDQVKTYTYPSALDNSLKCAYRFRLFSTNAHRWQADDLENQVIIDVVYLGEDSRATLSDISRESFWIGNEHRTISRIFPTSGYISTFEMSDGRLSGRGTVLEYGSSTLHYILGSMNEKIVSMGAVHSNNYTIGASVSGSPSDAIPSRLFKKLKR